MRKIYPVFGLIMLFAISAFGQKTDRILELSPDPPNRNLTKAADGKMIPTGAKGLELIEISVEGAAVTPGKTFAAADDWIKSLIVRFRNVSGKTISSVRASYVMPEAKYKEGFLGFSHSFGSLRPSFDSRFDKRSIKPGEEFELTMTGNEYPNYRNFVVQRVGDIQITRVLVGTITVEFEDGSIWATLKPQFAEKSE